MFKSEEFTIVIDSRIQQLNGNDKDIWCLKYVYKYNPLPSKRVKKQNPSDLKSYIFYPKQFLKLSLFPSYFQEICCRNRLFCKIYALLLR